MAQSRLFVPLKCKACNSKLVSLSRAFGHWPPTELPWKDVGKAAQHNFMQRAHKVKGLDALRQLAKTSLTIDRTRTKHYANMGEFRPLKYWETLGYDPKRIEDNAADEDKDYDEMTGTTYRVLVKTTGDSSRVEVREGLDLWSGWGVGLASCYQRVFPAVRLVWVWWGLGRCTAISITAEL